MNDRRITNALSWTLRLAAAAILFQTLFFKFTAAEESVYIFTTLRLEPWGRWLSGLAELAACILLLLPGTVTIGALVSLFVISGAIASHLTGLGIEVQGDGGLLFGLALAVFAASLGLVWIHREEVPYLGHRLALQARRAAVRLLRQGSIAAQASCGAATVAAGGPKHRILILGGGFGGIYTALQLEKTVARDPDVEITLVNRDNFFLFTPMLHEVAASDLDLSNIVSPVRQLLKRVNFFQGEASSVCLDGRKATLVHGADSHAHDVAWDYLVVALGSSTNFFNLPGLEERALTMKSLGDAIALRNRVIARLEEADTECSSAERAPLLTFVVAGGGFAGVETVAGINDFLRESLVYYPRVQASDLRVILVHSGQSILAELGPELGVYAQRVLAEQGVEMRLGTRVSGIDAGGIELADGTRIAGGTLIWTAGTSPHPLLATLVCEKEKGRLKVNEFLEIPGIANVWAAGDCAVIPDPRTGGFHPPTAQHALREGSILARNIEAAIRGGRKRAFDFRTIGQLAAIGRRRGVARVFGRNFSGFLAWWMWRTIYLSKLPRLEKKVRVALDWTLDLFFAKDLVQFLTERAPALSTAEIGVRTAGERTAPAVGRDTPGNAPHRRGIGGESRAFRMGG